MQIAIVEAQIDGEDEALNETLRIAESSKGTDEALMIQMQAQLTGLLNARRRAMELLACAIDVWDAAARVNCAAVQQPRIS